MLSYVDDTTGSAILEVEGFADQEEIEFIPEWREKYL